jgi:hypothetical protein
VGTGSLVTVEEEEEDEEDDLTMKWRKTNLVEVELQHGQGRG